MIIVRDKPVVAKMYDAVRYDGTNAWEIEALLLSKFVSDNGSTVTVEIEGLPVEMNAGDWAYRSVHSDATAPAPTDFRVATDTDFWNMFVQ